MSTQPQMISLPWLTKLSPLEEKIFQLWVKTNKIPWEDTISSDYDMRGFFKAMLSGDSLAVRASSNGHFPDKWKTPFHKSFSNESMYAPKTAPHWKGKNLVSESGKVVFTEK